MALDRWIALIILGICLAYGYTAWFTMDDTLAPFMRRNPIWPSTLLLGLMVAYALCLRPCGFILSTSAFLILGSVILGERKWHVMIPVAAIATFIVWYLVQQVLGIFLRPWPGALAGLMGA